MGATLFFCLQEQSGEPDAQTPLSNQDLVPLLRRLSFLGLLGQGRPDTGGIVQMHLLEMPQLPLDKVEAIKVHHLVPGRHEVIDKLLLRVRTSIDFSQGPELGVRTDN
jgi:hypothetical protein